MSKKKTSWKKPKFGDVFRVILPDGYGHIQYVGKDKLYSSVIFVGCKMLEIPEKITESVFKDGYFTCYHVPAAVRHGLIEKVGELPAYPMPKRWRSPLGGQDVNWRIDDGEGEEYLCRTNERALTPEEIKLPIHTAPNHEALITDIQYGWRPEKFTQYYLDGWTTRPPID